MVIPSNVANSEVFADPTIIVLSCNEIADSILTGFDVGSTFDICTILLSALIP